MICIPREVGGDGGMWQIKPVMIYNICILTMLAYSDHHLTDEKLLISTREFWGKELELFCDTIKLSIINNSVIVPRELAAVFDGVTEP